MFIRTRLCKWNWILNINAIPFIANGKIMKSFCSIFCKMLFCWFWFLVVSQEIERAKQISGELLIIRLPLPSEKEDHYNHFITSTFSCCHQVQHQKIFKLIPLRGLDTYILFHLMLVVLWEICGQNCNELVLVVSVPGETQFLESLPTPSQSTSTSTYSVLG